MPLIGEQTRHKRHKFKTYVSNICMTRIDYLFLEVIFNCDIRESGVMFISGREMDMSNGPWNVQLLANLNLNLTLPQNSPIQTSFEI